ncbi:stalk domain-containing protein [Bacillus tianshenii]|nr:stalk domain-containing protein [Bacillus tianshenii]
MKKKLIMLAVFMLVFIPSFRTEAKVIPSMKIYVDGVSLAFPTAPEISKENRTFVPFRAIAESMGARVTWIGGERKIVAVDETGKVVELYVGKSEGFINGQAFSLDRAPYITKGHTLIPLRFFSEAFQANVRWDGGNNTIEIETNSTKELYTMSYYGLTAFNHRQFVPKFDGMAYMWSSISSDGKLNIERNDGEMLNEFFWPEDHPLASADEIIQSSNDSYLMVAALSIERVKALLGNEGKQEQAIENIVSLTEEHSLDGVLLDFEGFTQKDDEWRNKYTAFVKELDDELHNQKLAIAVTPVNNYYNNYDYRELAKAADSIVLMAYGYIPTGTRHPEPLNKVEEGVVQTLEMVPKEKMLLGINLVHESDDSMKDKIALAKRYRLKGAAFWLLNQLDLKQMEQIEHLSK